MHPSTLLLILVAAGAVMVHGQGHSAANTPAAQVWEQALPGSPMPDAIADRVQRGIDHSPLVECHYTPSTSGSLSACARFDSKCTNKMVAETGIFIHVAQLHPGSIMTLSFPAEAENAAILPRDVAEKTPFANLDDVLTTFAIPPGSAEAAQVRDTVSSCQAPPLARVQKACATSLEGTVQAALRLLGGTNDHGVVAAASELPRAGLPRQQYVVQAVTPLAGKGSRYVSCHTMPFPYAVYQCHTHATKKADGFAAYKVSLRGLNGGRSALSLLALCHIDAAAWNPVHPAFEVPRIRPGESPMCHFTTYGDLAFGA